MSDAGGGASGAGGNGADSAMQERFRDAMDRHQGGELDQAQGLYEDILREQPSHADALHMLGLVAHQQGRNEDARRLIADAVKFNDQNAFYHSNLGEVLRMLGETQAAADCYRAAIALEPSYAQAHNNLGLVLFQLDQADVAVEGAERRVGHRAQRRGDTQQSRRRAGSHGTPGRRHQVLSPRRGAGAGAGRGEQQSRNCPACPGRFPGVRAVPAGCCENRSEGRQRSVQFVSVVSRPGQAGPAMGAARKAIEINPRYPDYYIALGAVQRTMGDLDDSLNSLRAAVAMDSAHAMALNDMGVCLLVLGRFDEAESSFRRALDAEPRLAIAHENLARSRRFGDEDRKQIEFVEVLASAPNQTEEGQTHLHFALGKMLDDIGEHQRAFGHFQTGNALEHKRMRFDADAGRSFVERSRATFDAALVAEKSAFGNPSDTPVFIVGMLRSGTTLVEQILASHPAVQAGGELEYFRSLAGQLPERLGGGQLYPDCLKALDAGTVNAASTAYVERIQKHLGEAKRFTDKNPLNFEHLGLILLMFPARGSFTAAGTRWICVCPFTSSTSPSATTSRTASPTSPNTTGNTSSSWPTGTAYSPGVSTIFNMRIWLRISSR